MKLNKLHNVLSVITLLMLIAGCGDKIELDDELNRVVPAAEKYLSEEPVTVTAFSCDRSTGGIHDYYSEGDYWWPDPQNHDGPYIRKDGLTNPDNFNAHREAMRNLSVMVPALVAAYKITGDKKFADHAIKHLKAWFVNPDTKMNSNLLFAQAIKGRVTGRGIGIIDTIHLVEVVQAIIVLEHLKAIDPEDLAALKEWYSDYLSWMTTHEFGHAERDNGNNHSTCWAMQAAMFAKFTENKDILKYVRDFYKNTLLPGQMAEDGSFPKELSRTKPYGYSLFNFDAMAMVCQISSTHEENLWEFTLEDGRGMKKATEFIYPFIKDKTTWPFTKDVMYWDQWPVRFNSLLFAYEQFGEEKYYELWKTLDADPKTEEVIRNYPIRQPILWIN